VGHGGAKEKQEGRRKKVQWESVRRERKKAADGEIETGRSQLGGKILVRNRGDAERTLFWTADWRTKRI